MTAQRRRRLERHAGLSPGSAGIFSCTASGGESGKVLGGNSPGSCFQRNFFRPGQCVCQNLQTQGRAFLDRDTETHEERHVGLQRKLHSLRQRRQTRLSQNTLEMKTAKSCLLGKSHVDQLHLLPHLRAADCLRLWIVKFTQG